MMKLAFRFGDSPLYHVEGIVGKGDTIYHFGSYPFYRDDITTSVVTLGAVLGLTWMFRYTAVGLRFAPSWRAHA